MVASATPPTGSLIRVDEIHDRRTVRKALAGIRGVLRKMRAERRATAAIPATPETIGSKDDALFFAGLLLAGLQSTEAALLRRLAELPPNQEKKHAR